jgi:hypothetical protein
VKRPRALKCTWLLSEEDHEDEFITSGKWGGKHNSLPHVYWQRASRYPRSAAT